MSDNLLDQADALMRRRTFVAGAKIESVEPVETSEHAADAAGDEVPILTDVVNVNDAPPPAGDIPMAAMETVASRQSEEAVRERLGQLLFERHAELSQEVEKWLDEQMPQLVIRAMDGITDHLVALLANRVRDELLPRLDAALRRPGEDTTGIAGSE
ncbi:MAG: hypothetical protein PHQ05_12495 [Sterolibacterium sp.]|nr:hypothetical protein [Sterolibacterium sp.]